MKKAKKTGNNRKRKHTRQSDLLIIAILICLMLLGASLIICSSLQTQSYEKEVQQEVQTFQELVSVYKTEPLPIETQATEPEGPLHHKSLYDAMEQYNQDIYISGQSELKDAWSYQAEVFDLESYDYSLDAVGVVRIPDINVEMPLYLGATYDNLAKGFAQLSQTSMPIGGNNTNCVIAGHRGWNGMAYMRDVELLEIGDSVFVENPWETMEYRISEILLIEPSDVKCVYIKPNRDLLTVITCHPYGVGSHRYVLICDRYYPPQEEPVIVSPAPEGYWDWEWQTNISITAKEDSSFESSQQIIFIAQYLPWICAILSATFVSLMLLILSRIKRTKNKKKTRKNAKHNL